MGGGRTSKVRRGFVYGPLALIVLVGLHAGAAVADLTITTNTSTDLVGSLDPSIATFEAHRTFHGEATVEVTVGAVTLTAEADLIGGELSSVDLSGGGSALTDSDKTILTTLSNELEAFLGTTSLLIQEDLLLRAAGYWAEAPSGVAIGSMTVTAP